MAVGSYFLNMKCLFQTNGKYYNTQLLELKKH